MTKHDPAMGVLGYERLEADFYPTESWVSEGLCELLVKHDIIPFASTIWECACGQGHISKILSRHGFSVCSTDLYDRGFGQSGIDFLTTDQCHGSVILTNPPYGDLAEKFIRRALEKMKPMKGMVFMLLRNEYDCAKKRKDLFDDNPHYAGKFVLTARPRWIADSTGSPRHNYSWYFWDLSKKHESPRIYYIHKGGSK